MAGNFRSGDRRKKGTGKPVKCGHGKPQRPRGQLPQQKWCWDNVIAPAEHLTEEDTAAAIVCCQVWQLCCQSMDKARKNPTDTQARLAVTGYTSQWMRIIERLGLDPLGRERLLGEVKPDEPANPLKEFGIVG